MAAAGSLADVAGAAGDMAGALGTGQSPEAKVELSFGSSRSKSALTEDSTRNNGSTVNAGGRAAFAATGEKDAGQGNVTIVGSDVLAKDVFLKARNRVDLFNSTDTDKTRSTNESSSASVGVSFGTNGWGVSAAMSRAHGNANSDAATRNNSHIAASKTATIISGGDTNIVGATIDATRVLADIGGDLNIASVQDTVRSAAHQSSAGGGFSVSQGGGSASVSVSSRHASGSYAGVREQSGIRAAGGGFDIAVKGNTDLKGAYIASNAAPDKNRLATGTLSFSDVRNSSSYDATSIGMSAGGSFGDGGNNYATHGATTGSNAGGGVPATVGESGASAALTKSAISTSHITILDEANQRQDIGLLSRDATDLNGGVDKLPDLTTVLNEQADLIDGAQGAAEVVAKQIGAYADKKREESLKVAAEESDPVFKADYQRQAERWAEGGTRRAAMHMAGGALTGGLSGGGGGAIGGAVGAGVSAIMAPQLKEVARSIGEAEPTSSRDLNELFGNVASNVLAGATGALTGGPAGALSGAAVDRFNRQLSDKEKQAIKNEANGNNAKEERLSKAGCLTVRCWAEYKHASREYNKNYVNQLEASELGSELEWVGQRKRAGLFDYTPRQKIGDAVKSDPVGIAKDTLKVGLGIVTAKTGGVLCGSGFGCAVGAWMFGAGTSDAIEGATSLGNRYEGVAAPGTNPLRWGFSRLSPTWGDSIYDGINFGNSILAMRAPVLLNMGKADGLNRPSTMFGVTVPDINNKMLIPFGKGAAPYGAHQGVLLLGVGSKGAAVLNDVRNAGESQ